VASRFKNQDLENLGNQLLETFSHATRISVYSRPLNTSPLEEYWCKGQLGQILGMDGERVVGTLEKWKRTILIEDAEADKLLQGIERRQFRSCLAVPILDETRHVKGLFYLTASEPNVFNTHGRFACEKLAKKAAPILAQMHQSGDDGELPTSGPFDFLFSHKLLLAVVALVILGGFAIFSSPTEQVTEPAGNSQSSRVGPKEVSKDFLQHLRVGEFNQAWALLTPDLQKSWSREQFQSSLQAWADSEAHQLVLLNRNIAGVKIEDDGLATVVLFGTSMDGDDGAQWDWELVEVDERWRLRSMTGPVTIR
jgi:hypothetical protein